MNMITNAIVTH